MTEQEVINTDLLSDTGDSFLEDGADGPGDPIDPKKTKDTPKPVADITPEDFDKRVVGEYNPLTGDVMNGMINTKVGDLQEGQIVKMPRKVYKINDGSINVDPTLTVADDQPAITGYAQVQGGKLVNVFRPQDSTMDEVVVSSKPKEKSPEQIAADEKKILDKYGKDQDFALTWKAIKDYDGGLGPLSGLLARPGNEDILENFYQENKKHPTKGRTHQGRFNLMYQAIAQAGKLDKSPRMMDDGTLLTQEEVDQAENQYKLLNDPELRSQQQELAKRGNELNASAAVLAKKIPVVNPEMNKRRSDLEVSIAEHKKDLSLLKEAVVSTQDPHEINQIKTSYNIIAADVKRLTEEYNAINAEFRATDPSIIAAIKSKEKEFAEVKAKFDAINQKVDAAQKIMADPKIKHYIDVSLSQGRVIPYLKSLRKYFPEYDKIISEQEQKAAAESDGTSFLKRAGHSMLGMSRPFRTLISKGVNLAVGGGKELDFTTDAFHDDGNTREDAAFTTPSYEGKGFGKALNRVLSQGFEVLPQLVTGAGFGTAQKAYGALMALQTADQKYNEGLTEGMSLPEAYSYSLLNGAATYLSEKILLENEITKVGFRPSKQLLRAVSNPATRGKAALLFTKELLQAGGNDLKIAAKQAFGEQAEERIEDLMQKTLNAGFNDAAGTKLDTTLNPLRSDLEGIAAMFFSTAAMKAAARAGRFKGVVSDAYRDQFLKLSASGDMNTHLSLIEDLEADQSIDSKVAAQMKQDLIRFAGTKFPSNMTADQKVQATKIMGDIEFWQGELAHADGSFTESIEKRIKELKGDLDNVVANPEKATKEIEKSIELVADQANVLAEQHGVKEGELLPEVKEEESDDEYTAIVNKKFSDKLRELAKKIEGDTSVLKSDLLGLPKAVISTLLKGAANTVDAVDYIVKGVKQYFSDNNLQAPADEEIQKGVRLFIEPYQKEAQHEAAKDSISSLFDGSDPMANSPQVQTSETTTANTNLQQTPETTPKPEIRTSPKPKAEEKGTIESKLVNAVKSNVSSWMHDGVSDKEINKRLQDTLFVDEDTATELINDARHSLESQPVVSKEPSIKEKITKETDSRNGAKITMTETQALKKQIKDKFRGMAEGYKKGTKDQKSKQALHTQLLDTLRSQVDSALKEAVKAGKLSHEVSGRIAAGIMRNAVNAKTPSRLMKLVNKIDKYIQDVDYDRRLTAAVDARKSVSKVNRSKSVQKLANNVAIVKEFLGLNPADVSDIEEYTAIANKIKNTAKGAKVKVENGVPVVINDEYKISNEEIRQYVIKENDRIRENEYRQLLEDYEDMVAAGIIDPETMSAEDMRDLADAYHWADDQRLEEMAALKWTINKEKVNELRKVVDYNRLSLADYAEGNIGNGTLSQEKESVLRKLLNLDMSQLTLKQLIHFNDVINNVVYNGNFAGAGDLDVLSDSRSMLQELKSKVAKSGIKLNTIESNIVKGLASAQMMFEYIAKSTGLAAEIQRLTGISGIFDGHARAKRMYNEVMQQYQQLKAKMGSDVDSPANRFKRGVAAFVIQNYGGSQVEVAEDFARAKNLVKQTYEKLQNTGNKKDIKEGELIQQVYDELLEGAASAQDVMAKIDANNRELVQFWQGKHADVRDRFLEQSEIYNNRIHPEVVNYTGTKFKTFSGSSIEAERGEILSDNFTRRRVDDRPAGSKFQRGGFEHLGDRVVDLDFDHVQSQRFYENAYDMETGVALATTRVSLSHPDSIEALGSIANRSLVVKRLEESIKIQKGKQLAPDSLGKAVATGVQAIQAKGVRMALGSFSQVIKQYPSVAVGAIVNLGKDADLFFRQPIGTRFAEDLLNQFNISERGATKAGTQFEVDFEALDRVDFSRGQGAVGNAIKNTGEKLMDFAMNPLVKSDKAVARRSWLAYYAQSLRQQGVIAKNGLPDWKAESETPNRQAAAYAEQMVSRTQNPNDVSSMPEWFQLRGTAAVFKNIFLPFSSFSTNQRMRMTNDVQKILYGGKKGEAIRSLVATGMEQGLFNAVKIWAISPMVSGIFQVLANALGVWDEDDEAKKDDYETVEINGVKVSSKTKKWFANAFQDYFFSGIGSAPAVAIQVGLNMLYGAAFTEIYPNAKDGEGFTDKHPGLFFNRGSDMDFSQFGVYGSSFQHTWNLIGDVEHAILGTTDFYKQGGFDPEVDKIKISPTERKVALINMIVELFALTAYSEADLLRVNDQLRRHLKKKMDNKYGGKEYTIYKAGDDEYEEVEPEDDSEYSEATEEE